MDFVRIAVLALGLIFGGLLPTKAFSAVGQPITKVQQTVHSRSFPSFQSLSTSAPAPNAAATTPLDPSTPITYGAPYYAAFTSPEGGCDGNTYPELGGIPDTTVAAAAEDFINQYDECTAPLYCDFDSVQDSDPNSNAGIAGYLPFGLNCGTAVEDIYASVISNNVGAGANGGDGEGNQPSDAAPLVGDPIDASTGNKFLQQDDYVQNKWLTFRRFYNSSGLVNSSYIGYQWRHSFDRSLKLIGKPITSLILLRPDGTTESFTKVSGVWTSALASVDQLTETDSAGVATGYTVHIGANRHTETYDPTGKLLTVMAENGQGIVLTYSTASTPASIAPVVGLLLTVTDPYGRQLAFTYTSLGLVNQVKLPDGGTLTYGYNSNAGLASVQYPDGKVRQYVYNESANTSNANLPNALTGIIDESSVRYSTTTFNADGYATGSSFAGNVSSTQLTYNADGTASVLGALGHTANLGFSQLNGLNQVASIDQDCGLECGQKWKTRTYDSNGYPASRTDFNGNLVTTQYSAYGLLNVEVDGSGSANQRTITTTWDNTIRKPVTRNVKDASGNVVTESGWVYDASGNVQAHCEMDPGVSAAASYTCSATGTSPAGVRRWVYTYCTAVNATQCPVIGLLLSVTGPRTDLTQTTSYTYYTSSSATGCGTPGAACHQAGDLYRIKDALGRTTTYNSYDGAGRPTRITDDANSVNTDMTYTPRGWLATRTIGGAVTTFGYDAMGDVTSIKDPSGIITSFKYDPAHRLTDITDAMGNDIHYTLDAAGNKTAEQTKTASGTVVRSLSRQFNSLGQLTALIDGLNKTVLNAGYSDSYDANGNLTHTADGLGFQREMSFDALNRLNSTIDNYNGTDTSTANTETVVAEDALNRVVGVGDPNSLNTIPTYDGLNNRTKLQSPDTGTSTDTFDAAGNRLVHTDAKGVVSTSTYDALNRLKTTSYSDTTLNVSYDYDDPNTVTGCTSSWPVGRLTRVVENSVTTTYCYNSRGKVLQKKQATTSHTDTTTYTYTSADRLSKLTTPDGTAITYAFNTNGLPSGVTVTPSGSTSASTAVSAITYLPFGPINSYTLGNGQTVTRTYDANYRATDIVSVGFTLHLARDLMGNVSAIGNATGANPATETYTYDPLYRLGSVTDAGTIVESYTYNQTGDRLSKTASGLETGAYLYTPGTHQISKIGTNSRASDANGNTTGSMVGGSNTYGFSYNGRNRESLAQLNGATVGTYTYNAMGQRIGKVAATTERYSYDETSTLIGEYGTTNRDYIWVDGLPVAVIDNVINGSVTTSTVNYITADQLNTPRAVTNSAGTVIWAWAYKGNPFGEQAPTSSAGYVFNLRYPGQYYDAETATNYNLFRNYEPAIGRYQESDPTGLAGGINTFAYVASNPLNLVDPRGLDPSSSGTLPVPPTIVPVGSGTLPDVPSIAPAPEQPSADGPKEVSPESLGGTIGGAIGGVLGLPFAPPYGSLALAGALNYVGSYVGDNYDNPNSYVSGVPQNIGVGSPASTNGIENP